jgi:hypothetical protein
MKISDSDVQQVIGDSLLYEILFAFSAPAEVLDYSDYAVWEMVNLSRAVHARLLYEFLHRNPNGKDLRAIELFGCPFPVTSPNDSYGRLSSQIVHLSKSRFSYLKPSDKKWPSEVLKELHQPCLDFMDHMEKAHAGVLQAVGRDREWKEVQEALRWNCEMRLKADVDQTDRPRYRIYRGKQIGTPNVRFPELGEILDPIDLRADHKIVQAYTTSNAAVATSCLQSTFHQPRTPTQ